MRRPATRLVLPLLLFGLVIFGLGRVRLETDVLGLLPGSIPGVPELRMLNRELSDQRTLIMLLEPKAGNEDEVPMDELLEKLAEVPGVQAARDALAGPDMGQDLAAVTAYLTLALPPADFQAKLAALEGEELKKSAAVAQERVSTSVDGLTVARAAYDPLELTKLPLFDAMARGLVSLEEKPLGVALLELEADPSLGGHKAYTAWIERVQAATAEVVGDQWKASFTGAPAFAAETGTSMERDMSGTAGLCAVLVLVLFYFFQRSVRQLVALTVCLMLTLAVAMGAYGWVVGELGIISAGFAAILVGLTVDYAMVVGREVVACNDVEEGQRRCASGIGWGAVTTAAPFVVMMTSTLPGGMQLGFLVAAGLLSGAWFMLRLYPRLAFGESIPKGFHCRLGSLSSTMAPRIGLVLGVAAVAMIWAGRDSAKMSFDMGLLRPAESKPMDTLEQLERYFPAWGQSTVYMVARESKPVDVKLLRDKLHAMDEQVADIVLPSEVLPSAEDFRGNSAWFAAHPNWLTEVKQALDAQGFTAQAAALPNALVEAAARWKGDVSAAIAEVRVHPLLKQRLFSSPEGLVAVGSLSLSGELDKAVHEDLRGLDEAGVRCATWPMVRYDVEPMLERDMKVTLVPMFIVLLLSVFAALRSWREALLVISILVLGLALVLGWALLNNPEGLHFLHVLSLVLLIGAGLDYFLHMIFSLRRDEGDVKAVLCSTGMAIIFCALSTAIGFGSLALANNKAMADLGLISAVGIMVMLTLALTLLPGLWKRVQPKGP